jgi:hypothetical protein
VRRRTALTSLLLAGVAGTIALGATVASPPGPEAAPAPSAAPPTPAPTPREDVTSPAADERDADTTATLLMWSRGGVARDVVAAASALPDVVAATLVRTDTVGLTGSRTADGVTVDDLPTGYTVPVSVAAVDPATFAAVAGTDAGTVVAALAPGGALLSTTGAALRQLAAGDELDLAGRPGLSITAVVPDGLVGSAEVVVHVDDADTTGMRPGGSLRVRHTAPPGPATAALTDALLALLPPDRPGRVVDPASDEERPAPLVLSLAEVKRRFGEFAYRPRDGVREIDVAGDFVSANIVTTSVPILGSVTCHRDILPDLRGALGEIVDLGLADTIDPARYAGCYYARRISTSGAGLSRHAWGIALDINVDLSQPGLGPPPPPEVIAAFARHGFRWGGDFLVPDNHHFEWVGDHATRPAP